MENTLRNQIDVDNFSLTYNIKYKYRILIFSLSISCCFFILIIIFLFLNETNDLIIERNSKEKIIDLL